MKRLLAPALLALAVSASAGPVIDAVDTQPVAHQPTEPVRTMRDRASEVVLSAMGFIGVRYRRGGNSAEEGFDCSGFTRHLFEGTLGLVLPRRADQQATAPQLSKVNRDELQPGDLVFFNTVRRTFSHVGIYVGEGRFIHAPKPGAQVRVESMSTRYWARRFTGARRVPNTPMPVAAPAPVAPLAPEVGTAAPVALQATTAAAASLGGTPH